jgi:serine/threonine-protein kinase RsbW
MIPAKLRVSADLSNLTAVRNFVAEVGSGFCAEPGFIYNICLAVDEAVTNIIVHGYRGKPGYIEVSLQAEGGAIAIYLRDRAPMFDPTQLEVPDISLPLGERKPGGLGVYLMRSSVDKVEYRRLKNGVNELKLVKQIERN